MTSRPESPVSFPVNVLRLPQKGMPVAIEADAGQREALAKVHGLLSVGRFDAELIVSHWKRKGVAVSGRVVGDIVQACVVSLEPVEAHIDAPVHAVYVPEGSRLAVQDRHGGEILLDADGPDGPETFSGEEIDVGAVAEEFFALAIDPYPRKEGAHLPAGADAEAAEEAAGPLAGKLAALRRGGTDA